MATSSGNPDPTENRISADLPITSRTEDRLNRSNFANSLAKVIQAWQGKDSLVIGLFGDWGSGKSSLKNLIVDSIVTNDPDRKELIVEFSPWQLSGQDLLLTMFFREIGDALGRTGNADDGAVKKRVGRWKIYGTALSLFGLLVKTGSALIPPTHPEGHMLAGTASNAFDTMSSAVKTGIEGLEAEGATHNLSLSELKTAICDDLRNLEKPILVILDDIDRLSKEEIRLILQLVKANADFPNVIYMLLAQKDVILEALKDIAPSKSEAFLDKIVQVSFDVPALNTNSLRKLFFDELDNLLNKPELVQRFSARYWAALFPEIFSFFRNIRDLKRFLGALAFHIELFRNGTTFEVNPVDLIALETLRTFEPSVYRRIAQEKLTLTNQPHYDRGIDREKRVQDLVSLASEGRREQVKKIIGMLFPPSGLSRFPSAQDSEGVFFQNLRVCSFQVFDRYFQLNTPEGDVSQSEIDEVIREMSNYERLTSIFDGLHQRNLSDVMIERLRSSIDKLPLEHAGVFLAALYEAKLSKRRYSFLQTNPRLNMAGLTHWYLLRLDESKRLSVAKEALSKTQGVGTAIEIFASYVGDPDRPSEALFQLSENRDELKAACLAAIHRAVKDGSSVLWEELFRLLRPWSLWDADAAKKWLSEVLRERAPIIAFLRSSILAAESTTHGHREYIHADQIEALISAKELLTRVKKYALVTANDEEEFELVSMLQAAILRQRKGVTGHFNPFVGE